MKLTKKISCCLFLIFLFQSLTFAQNKTQDVDELFKQAKDLYKEGSFSKALQKIDQSLAIAPNYLAVQQLKINILQELNRLLESEEVIVDLGKSDHSKEIEKSVLRQISLLKDDTALTNFTERIDPFYSDNLEYLMTKAEQFITIKKPQIAKKVLKTILNNGKLSNAQNYRLQLLIKRTYTNQIGIHHEVLSFLKDNPIRKSWNTTSLDYSHYLGNHAVIGRINYSNRFNNTGTLYEIEAYPVFSKKWYSYINLNASGASFYQNLGISMSTYHTFGKGFEFEGGFRYLDFDTDSFLSIVVGASKYIGKLYITARTFLGPKKEGTLIQNYQITMRYYLTNPEDYLFIRLGTGISPDDRSRFTQIASNPDLVAKYTTLGAQKVVKKYSFQLSIGYLNENLSNNRTGNQFSFNLGTKYRF